MTDAPGRPGESVIPDGNSVAITDLAAYRHNIAVLCALAAPARRMAVIKANAYGHGMEACARAALEAGAAALGVGFAAEGAALRAAGFTAPILALSPESFGAIPLLVERDIAIGLHHPDQLRVLADAVAGGRRAMVHVKVDTGMGRLGIPPEEAPRIIAAAAIPGVTVDGVYSHLASADDETKDDFTRGQVAAFARLLDTLECAGLRPPVAHIANSAATVRIPEARFDMVRCGIATYGLDPCPGGVRRFGLEPALTWESKVASVRDVPTGESVSYGRTFFCHRPSRLATVPVGYAHGYRRLLSNKASVLIRDHRAPIVGRVCMDQFAVDVTDIPGVAAGDRVVLIGCMGTETITAEELADTCGTISYEIVTGITNRVARTITGAA